MATHTSLKDYIGIAPESDFELTKSIEQGLPTANLALLRDKGLTYAEIASLVISPRTLKHRKSRGENLSLEETGRAVRVASVLSFADRVFANSDKALRWLRHSSPRLDDRSPLSLLASDPGARTVEAMLWQIDEGIYT